jgi:hypothetical protein
VGTLQALEHVSVWEWRLPVSQRTAWKGLLAPFLVTDDKGAGTRVGKLVISWQRDQRAITAQALLRGGDSGVAEVEAR